MKFDLKDFNGKILNYIKLSILDKNIILFIKFFDLLQDPSRLHLQAISEWTLETHNPQFLKEIIKIKSVYDFMKTNPNIISVQIRCLFENFSYKCLQVLKKSKILLLPQIKESIDRNNYLIRMFWSFTIKCQNQSFKPITNSDFEGLIVLTKLAAWLKCDMNIQSFTPNNKTQKVGLLYLALKLDIRSSHKLKLIEILLRANMNVNVLLLNGLLREIDKDDDDHCRILELFIKFGLCINSTLREICNPLVTNINHKFIKILCNRGAQLQSIDLLNLYDVYYDKSGKCFRTLIGKPICIRWIKKALQKRSQGTSHQHALTTPSYKTNRTKTTDLLSLPIDILQIIFEYIHQDIDWWQQGRTAFKAIDNKNWEIFTHILTNQSFDPTVTIDGLSLLMMVINTFKTDKYAKKWSNALVANGCDPTIPCCRRSNCTELIAPNNVRPTLFPL